MHEWLVARLGLRLKRSIGFGLMIATTGAIFWYVLQAATGAQEPLVGSLVVWLVLLAAAGATAYATLYCRL